MRVCFSNSDRCPHPGDPGRGGRFARRPSPRPRRPGVRLLAPVFLAAVLAAAGCARPDSVEAEKTRNLSADERYLVELYLKINDLEKNLQMNPEDSLKKWESLRGSIDTARVNRALRALERDPERWVGIYGRINELDFHDR